jgi:sulfate permease, SulP family
MPRPGLLNAEANIAVDLTSVDALDELRRTSGERGIVFAMARVKTELRDLLISGGFVEKVGDERIFMTLPIAPHQRGELGLRDPGKHGGWRSCTR